MGMFTILRERIRQGMRTVAYPAGPAPVLPERFRGLPVLDASKCPAGCAECAQACPTDAILADSKNLQLDLGRCLFCTECAGACPAGALEFSQDFRLAVRSREQLLHEGKTLPLARSLDEKMRKLFGRSLKLPQVSAGGLHLRGARLKDL